jgi:hypothetical protein
VRDVPASTEHFATTRPTPRRGRVALGIAIILTPLAILALAGCQSSTVWTPRVQAHMNAASAVGQSRLAAKLIDADIVKPSYAAASADEIATLRARCATLAASADRLSTKLDQSEMFSRSRDTAEIDELSRLARELENERVNLERDRDTLQVRLGLRTAEDAAIPPIRLAPGNETPISDTK